MMVLIARGALLESSFLVSRSAGLRRALLGHIQDLKENFVNGSNRTIFNIKVHGLIGSYLGFETV
jgi:hypothetical protein